METMPKNLGLYACVLECGGKPGATPLSKAGGESALVAHFLCIGCATRNEAETKGKKRVFIGIFSFFDSGDTQRTVVP